MKKPPPAATDDGQSIALTKRNLMSDTTTHSQDPHDPAEPSRIDKARKRVEDAKVKLDIAQQKLRRTQAARATEVGSVAGLQVGNPPLKSTDCVHHVSVEQANASLQINLPADYLVGDLLSALHERSGERLVVRKSCNESVDVHNSSPSVDDAGAHSVGDGPGAGDASATPATEVTLELLVAAVRDANLDIKSLRRIDDAARANYNESGRNLAKAIKDRSDSERALLDYLTGDQA